MNVDLFARLARILDGIDLAILLVVASVRTLASSPTSIRRHR